MGWCSEEVGGDSKGMWGREKMRSQDTVGITVYGLGWVGLGWVNRGFDGFFFLLLFGGLSGSGVWVFLCDISPSVRDGSGRKSRVSWLLCYLVFGMAYLHL